MTTHITLDGQWHLEAIDPPDPISITGTVPGHVHVDLEREGLIPLMFWRDNAEQCQWVEDVVWEYTRTFEVGPDVPLDWVDLVFEGLDTYADVFLNGILVGKPDNMHTPWRFEVGALLRRGTNTVRVRFHPPVQMVADKPTTYPAAFNDATRLHIRRMQCTFYWDWVHRFVSMGIWRPVRLEAYDRARIDAVAVTTRALDPSSAQLGLSVDIAQRTETALTCDIAVLSPTGEVVWADRHHIDADTLHHTPDIADPQLWWPNGYGDQPLYTVRVRILDAAGTVLDARDERFGIRTVRLEQLPDAPESDAWRTTQEVRALRPNRERNARTGRENTGPGRSFTVLVNGERIFCKGGNWVPADPFPSRVDEPRYRALLGLARDAHVTMLRVWGGGIYESDDFYRICDEYGILLYHDFMMACAGYPAEDDSFMRKLRREMPLVIKRLRNHPCIALWTGDNENGMHWDQDETAAPYLRIFRDVTEPALVAHDPLRPRVPTSPFGGTPNTSLTIGSSHFTDIWGAGKQDFIVFSDIREYRKHISAVTARFISEYAVFGAPSKRTLLRFMDEADLANREMWEYHTKDNPHKPADFTFTLYGMLEALAEKLLGKPYDLDRKLRYLEYVQYEWIRLVVANMRRKKWYASGILFWMYNDCWPASGWSLVDYYARPKAGYYGLKHACQPVAVSIEETGDAYRIWLCNDSLNAAAGHLTVRVQPWSGAPRLLQTHAVSVPANGSQMVLSLDQAEMVSLLGGDAVLVADFDGDGITSRDWLFAGAPYEMAPAPTTLAWHVDAGAEAGAGTLTVSSTGYARVVTLDGPVIFEDNYFELLPGEERVIRYVASCAGENVAADASAGAADASVGAADASVGAAAAARADDPAGNVPITVTCWNQA